MDTCLKQRIISLSPRLNEILFELGLEKRMCGITEDNFRPYFWRRIIPSVGQAGKINREEVLRLKPDIILADRRENSEEDILFFTEASIEVFSTPEVRSLGEAYDFFRQLGERLSVRTAADKLIDKIQFRLEAFREETLSFEPIKTAFFTGKDPYRVAAGGSFVQELLAFNRLENIYADIPQDEISPKPETLKLLDAHLILLPSSPVEFSDEDALRLGNYTEHALTVFVPGECFSPSASLLSLPDFYREMNLKMRREMPDHLAGRDNPTYFERD